MKMNIFDLKDKGSGGGLKATVLGEHTSLSAFTAAETAMIVNYLLAVAPFRLTINYGNGEIKMYGWSYADDGIAYISFGAYSKDDDTSGALIFKCSATTALDVEKAYMITSGNLMDLTSNFGAMITYIKLEVFFD